MSDNPMLDMDESAAQLAALDKILAPVKDVGKAASNVLESASVEAVYGKAIKQGDTIIIPTAEVLAGFGFGYGAGSGSGSMTDDDDEDTQAAEPVEGEEDIPTTGSGTGGGGGGGGRTLARPVAVVVASPDGVRVEPIVDWTKIGLAALTTFGFMIGTLARMRRE